MTDTHDRDVAIETAVDMPRSAGTSVNEVLRREATYQNVPKSLLIESPELIEPGVVPTERYTSYEFHRREVDLVWRKTWQMACRLEHIPNVGDHVVYRIVDDSIIVVRVSDTEIRAYHNTCLHRGTELRPEDGNVPFFRCPFHAWTWNLDGTLISATSDWDLPDFDPEDFCLPEAKVGTWGGFVFVNLDPACVPFEDYLENLPELMSEFPLEHRRIRTHVAGVIDANWKVTLEAFIEVYHVFATHPQIAPYQADEATQYDVWGDHVNRKITNGGMVSPHISTSNDDEVIVQMMFSDFFNVTDVDQVTVPEGKTARDVIAAKLREDFQDRTGIDVSDASNTEMMDGIEFYLFPNFAPWVGVALPMVYRVRPNGDDPDSSIFEVMLLSPSDDPDDTTPPPEVQWIDGDWRVVEELGVLGPAYNQDMGNLPRVQRGLKASGNGKVRFLRYQEMRLRHFHRTLMKYLDGD